MSSIARSSLLPYIVATLLALLALGGGWYWLGKPVPLADAANAAHKLQCASYTPFDKDQSPFDQPFSIRPERVDADLELLATRFSCIRTYSMTGLQDIPAVARRYGLKVMLGAWVNANPVDTAKEVNALISSANANRDVVSAVIVGNETLLRKEVTGAQLAGLIRQVKAQVQQPVTYADVWEFWDQYPEVAPAVDFLTIHLLPYWEDQPLGIDDALAHVAAVREAFGRKYAPKDILIGETGWPSEGRQRETALPSRVNQARFIRTFAHMAEEHGWHYNLIEAFDQPWKRTNEGAVGGYWGLFDADRHDKGTLQGPVSNLPFWPQWLGLSGLLMLVALSFAGAPADRRSAWLMPPLAALGAGCIGVWGETSRIDVRFFGEWVWMALLTGLNLLLLSYALLGLARRRGWRERAYQWLQARAGWWLSAAGFAAAVMMLAMVFDPRYRSFASASLLLPALVFALQPVRGPRNELSLMALIVGLGIPLQLWREGLENQQAWGWAAVCVVMVVGLWRSLRRS
ncbi:glycosyl hydrolase family 17 protein [Pseudomonas sp. HR96]|uniref:glycoside hydrolase family 17 protein n=1 Tax=Pseudomonas sp. HR96 TaxID=1027966 RepID=UPI002A74C1AB|nr:glycosyl hydrolase family 17 protein [Pseudomonas sp. HR96]WPP01222.1 glycosyl hydrolase family 17 protein [Pseudomonas sp. HR96]